MLFVAIPAYDRKISVETTRALLNEQIMAHTMGLEMRVSFLPGCSLITQARNQLCQEFVDSGAAKMVFVDTDVSWAPGDLIKVASQKFDVVGGAYRYKSETEDYPVQWIDRDNLMADSGCIEVNALPGGFLAITRKALDLFRQRVPGRGYKFFGREFYAYFTAPFDDVLLGEDVAFCRDYQSAGGKVWLYPELDLVHHEGPTPYPGNVGKWLRSEHAKTKAPE